LPPGALVKLKIKGEIDKPLALFQIGDRVRLRLKTESKLEKAKQYYSNQRYIIVRVIKGSPARLKQYQIKSGKVVQGYFNSSDLLDANISKLPPKTAAKRSLKVMYDHYLFVDKQKLMLYFKIKIIDLLALKESTLWKR
jgi:hypothetical protein